MGERPHSAFERPDPSQENAHELMPAWLRVHVPPLYASENQADSLVVAKFFAPDAAWVWYLEEFDGDDLMFGLVDGLEVELGYFSLSELQAVRGPMGLQVERDLSFDPTPRSKVQEEIALRRLRPRPDDLF